MATRDYTDEGAEITPRPRTLTKAQVALTALKRLESQNGLEVFETTRDQVRRALEAAGIVFLSTDKGEGVLLLHERSPTPG